MGSSNQEFVLVEDTLQQALQDVQIRRHVHDCMNEMLVDVELAHALSGDMERQERYQALQASHETLAQALDELSWLQRQERAYAANHLADRLVAELWSVSATLGEAYQLKEAHQQLSQDYDAIMAQLLQTQEELRVVKENNNNGRRRRRSIGSDDDNDGEAATAKERGAVAAENADTPASGVVTESSSKESSQQPQLEGKDQKEGIY